MTEIDAPAAASVVIITYILEGADAVYQPISLICAKGGFVDIIISTDNTRGRLVWAGTKIDIEDTKGNGAICNLTWLSREYIRVVSAPV